MILMNNKCLNHQNRVPNEIWICRRLTSVVVGNPILPYLFLIFCLNWATDPIMKKLCEFYEVSVGNPDIYIFLIFCLTFGLTLLETEKEEFFIYF